MHARIIHSTSVEETWFQAEGCHIQEIGNTPADPDISIARARVPAGARTRWHRLRNVTERYLITAGSGIVEIGDLPPTGVSAGDVAVIPAGIRQRITNNGDTDLVFYAICSPRFTPECYEGVNSGYGNDSAA